MPIVNAAINVFPEVIAERLQRIDERIVRLREECEDAESLLHENESLLWLDLTIGNAQGSPCSARAEALRTRLAVLRPRLDGWEATRREWESLRSRMAAAAMSSSVARTEVDGLTATATAPSSFEQRSISVAASEKPSGGVSAPMGAQRSLSAAERLADPALLTGKHRLVYDEMLRSAGADITIQEIWQHIGGKIGRPPRRKNGKPWAVVSEALYQLKKAGHPLQHRGCGVWRYGGE